MTSESDDLEKALQENLKLRRELAANVTRAEAASQRGGIAYRLGWVLYWICLALALFWMVGGFLSVGDWSFSKSSEVIVRNFREEPMLSAAIFFGPGVVLYVLGRAFRYVLSGE